MFPSYMSKILWHTLTIKVPAEMVTYTPKGKVSVKKTLTKMNNIARSQKQPSVKIIPSPDNKVHVVEGKEWNVDALQQATTKANELAVKNKGRVFTTSKKIFEGKVKKHAVGLVDANVLGIDPNVKGYSWNNQKKKWGARIKVNGKLKHLGFFEKKEEAHQAYLVAKRERQRALEGEEQN
jgi:hypothetical protein